MIVEAAFPVEWEDPADARLTWHYDPVHMPNALAPLEFELGVRRFLEGFGWGMTPKQFNYYTFFTVSGERAAGAPPVEPTVQSIREGGRRWRDEVLPEVLDLTERYRTTDFASMTNEQLIEQLARLPELRFRSGRLHTLAISPHWLGMSLLIDTYKELTGGSDLRATRLVQGYGDKSFEAGERLWRISRVAASEPAVAERLRAFDPSGTESFLATLRNEPAAAPFLAAFDSYLEEYGWRSGASFGGVTWFEDPTVPLTILKSHLQADDYDPNAEQRRLAEERETALTETMASLDEDGRRRLQEVMDAAREVASLSEDHNFYIDQRLWNMPRRLVIEAARRLTAAGLLGTTNDVFFLRNAELAAALRGETAGLAGVVLRRKDELAYWKTVRPPPQIGVGATAPQGQPWMSPTQDGTPSELRGMGVSAGVARGPARVLSALSEADRLRPGDILITSVTQPAWTPLFAIARAVVTEVGGMLSHTAVASREFGIAAVVAVPNATRLLRDGQLVEVDGSAGIVRVIG